MRALLDFRLNMSERRTYRASDIVVMGCVLDLVRDVMASIKRGRQVRPMYIPNLIWGTSHLIETPRDEADGFFDWRY